MPAEARPIAEGLFVTTPKPHLLGGRRKSDGKIVFPAPQGAEAALYDVVELADEGRLWSYTVQRFRPKSPPYAGAEDDRSFRPFALGYVELPGQVIVESRIETDDPASLKIGMPMRLVLKPFERADGPVLTYAFAPAA
ncbi:MAG TPA: OB-fold domain-containing protein [Caulobacteraceae bacterium]|nr:OB-fold domain-containing protein [Caulobacteraceae bacterium]